MIQPNPQDEQEPNVESVDHKQEPKSASEEPKQEPSTESVATKTEKEPSGDSEIREDEKERSPSFQATFSDTDSSCTLDFESPSPVKDVIEAATESQIGEYVEQIEPVEETITESTGHEAFSNHPVEIAAESNTDEHSPIDGETFHETASHERAIERFINDSIINDSAIDSAIDSSAINDSHSQAASESGPSDNVVSDESEIVTEDKKDKAAIIDGEVCREKATREKSINDSAIETATKSTGSDGAISDHSAEMITENKAINDSAIEEAIESIDGDDVIFDHSIEMTAEDTASKNASIDDGAIHERAGQDVAHNITIHETSSHDANRSSSIHDDAPQGRTIETASDTASEHPGVVNAVDAQQTTSHVHVEHITTNNTNIEAQPAQEATANDVDAPFSSLGLPPQGLPPLGGDPDNHMWYELKCRAMAHPILQNASDRTARGLEVSVHSALDDVLHKTGLMGDRGVQGLPLTMQNAILCTSRLAAMGRQARDPIIVKVAAYGLMTLATSLRAYAGAYMTLETASAWSDRGYGDMHSPDQIRNAIWDGPDGYMMQEGFHMAWAAWRLSYRFVVRGTYGNAMWVDNGEWIRRLEALDEF